MKPHVFYQVRRLAEFQATELLRELRAVSRSRKQFAPDGSFDNGIAKNSKLASDRVIVPSQIIGDQDGIGIGMRGEMRSTEIRWSASPRYLGVPE